MWGSQSQPAVVPASLSIIPPQSFSPALTMTSTSTTDGFLTAEEDMMPNTAPYAFNDNASDNLLELKAGKDQERVDEFSEAESRVVKPKISNQTSKMESLVALSQPSQNVSEIKGLKKEVPDGAANCNDNGPQRQPHVTMKQPARHTKPSKLEMTVEADPQIPVFNLKESNSLDVFVTEVMSPSLFWIQPQSEELEDMMDQIKYVEVSMG